MRDVAIATTQQNLHFAVVVIISVVIVNSIIIGNVATHGPRRSAIFAGQCILRSLTNTRHSTFYRDIRLFIDETELKIG